MSASRGGAGGWLSIDLGAIGTNYRRLREHVGPATQVGAAVKADAYGLGVSKVAPVLHRAGCRNFFVATVDEALALRLLLGPDATIFQLNGPFAGSEAALADAAITPVLNSPAQIALWRALAQRRTQRLPCALQVDSGMSRFGLNESDILTLGNDFAAFDVKLVMSHLACADEPDHCQNAAQLATFRRLRPLLPHAPSSLAASSGIYLGPDFHFDLVRPGVALYGGNPTPDRANPMRSTVTLSIRMIQERRIEPGTAVGYSARFVASRHSRIATLSAGYADGLPRAAGGRAVAMHPERPDVPLPIVGRVSMDCLALDITDLGEMPVPPGTAFELIGPHRSIDAVAAGLDTISYELLTSLGHRYHRDYIESME